MSDATPVSNSQLPSWRGPAEPLIYSTVRIECEYGTRGRGTGTGFFFAFAQGDQAWVPAIVTNKHVVEGASRGVLHIHLRDANGLPAIQQSERLCIDNFQAHWRWHPDPDVDLCVMPIAGLLEQADKNGRPLSFVPLEMSLVPTDQELSELTPLEEVLMIGYPNGIWDSRNNMPILRRGVTATHPGVAYNGRREFMIDAACFPGSSGSPVMLYNPFGYFAPDGAFRLGAPRIRLLGILYAGPQQTVTGELQIVTMPTHQGIQAVSHIPINLGVVIQSSRLRDFEELFVQLMKAQAAARTASDPSHAVDSGSS